MVVPEVAREIFVENLETIKQYVDILTSRGIDYGLIGPREAGRLWDRHVLNSASIASLVPENVALADVGSGAGLPGIPVAIARPDLSVTLIEPLLRRSSFLVDVVDELALDNVTVVRARAEDHDGHYPVVTARAVARLPKLLGWTMHLFHPKGQLLALKGETASDEIRDSAKELDKRKLQAEVLKLSPWEEVAPTHVIRVWSQ